MFFGVFYINGLFRLSIPYFLALIPPFLPFHDGMAVYFPHWFLFSSYISKFAPLISETIMRIKFIIVLLSLALPLTGMGQYTSDMNSARILAKMEKLKVLGSVLYVAAHPDDENTSMITYFSNKRKMKTTYLSLTRGDGGQNLIGPEKYQWMGLIRTQELLEARKTDGGEQAFSSAFDFGYSKTASETMRIWGKDSILADVVWIIRQLKPDVIITRFKPDTTVRTHGHHVSSALLAKEAFKLSGDPKAFPSQLKYVEPWQARRIFFNTSWWFYGRRDFDKTGLLEMETGEFDPLLGKSYGEIASQSRSKHKSQGFGRLNARGTDIEYLDQIDGDEAKSDPFEGINTSWNRIKGAKGIEKEIQELIDGYDFTSPDKSLEKLVSIRKSIKGLEPDPWKNQKLSEVDEIIFDCLGLWFEGLGENYALVPGNSYPFQFTAIQRLGNPILLKSIKCDAVGLDLKPNKVLSFNETMELNDTLKLKKGIPYSNPYWLRNPLLKGRFDIRDQQMIGKPENDPDILFEFVFDISGEEITYKVPGRYKWRDRVRGELQRDLTVVPPVVTCFTNKNTIFGSPEQKEIEIQVNAFSKTSDLSIRLDLPKDWKVEPGSLEIDMEPGEERRVKFNVTPPKKAQIVKAGIISELNGKQYDLCRVVIEHEHINTQTAVIKNSSQFVRADIKTFSNLIGYVDGAGDEIAQSLEQMGCKVQYLQKEDFFDKEIHRFDAIVFGVRAFNTNPWLKDIGKYMDAYVNRGGTVLFQYNVSYGLVTDEIGPYKIKISRDRVTDEYASVNILEPTHSVFNLPNAITKKDFDGWVQERGLYFPNEWGPEYKALLEMADPREESSKGSLLVAKSGDGYFIYSGISWFRQLPAGVPGAYRLFANLISASKTQNGTPKR